MLILTNKLQSSVKQFLTDVLDEYEQKYKVLEVDDSVSQDDIKTACSIFKETFVIIMGKQPLNKIFPGNRENTTFDFEGITVSQLYSPTRILLSANVSDYTSDLLSHVNKTSEYKKWKNRLTSCITGADKTSEEDIEEVLTKTTVCLDFETFKNFFDTYLKDDKGVTVKEIAYDVETNAIMQTSQYYKVIGFSLSSSSDNSCYVVLEALDYKMPKEDKEKIEDIVRTLMVDKEIRTLTYNCKHELNATMNWLGVKIENCQDLFVWTKLLKGQSSEYQGSAGLKYQCRTLLGYPEWDKDLDNYKKMVMASDWKRPRDSSSGFAIDSYVFYNGDLYVSTVANNKDEPTKSQKWKKSGFEDVLGKYYEGDELSNVCQLVFDRLDEIRSRPDVDSDDPEHFADYNFSYAYIPYKLISKYGGLDVSSLFDLQDYQQEAARREEKEMGIDLQVGYEHWLKNHYAAYVLERNGVYWDEKRVKELEDWCISSQLNCLKVLIRHPISKKIIYENIWSIAIPSIIQALKEDSIAGFKVKRKSRYAFQAEAVTPEAHQWMKKRCQEQVKNGNYKVSQELFSQMIKSKLVTVDFDFDKEIERFISENENDVDALQQLFKPGSTLITEHCASQLTTDELKKANAYLEVENYTKSDTFVMSNETPEDQELFKLITRQEYEVFEDDKEYEDSLAYRHQKFLEFERDYLSKSGKFMGLSTAKKKIIVNALSFTVTDLTKVTLWNTYYLYSILGVDCDDESTWNEQFEWLWNFKLFKRCDKYLSTYINGNSVGRGNVYRIEQEDIDSNKAMAKRHEKFPYSGGQGPYILQTTFNPCSVSTGRWASGFHTVPAGDTGKRLFTSRYKNGVIFAPDGQAMEVRALAAACKDEGLLKALRDGLDVHKFTASKVFAKKMEDVTPYERWLSKGLTFGLLYGESVQSVANSFCEGDVKRAEAVFETFFNAFPTIKDFIERCHEQFRQTGKVSTILNRSIKVEGNNKYKADDFNSCLRQSQNYPIQGVASDMAGIILWKINDEIEKRDYKTKIISIIHDSIEIDSPPFETFPMIDIIRESFIEYPYQLAGMPVNTEITIGPSMGQEIGIDSFSHDGNYKENVITLSGYKKDIDEMLDMWRQEFKEVIIEDEGKIKDAYISKSGVFMKTCSMYIGQTLQKVKEQKIRVIV